MPEDVNLKSFGTASISQAAALALLEAATRAAERESVLLAFAVTDGSGLLKAFVRMDGAPFLAVDIAIDKAWTAASYALATHSLGAFLAGDPGVASLAYRPRVTVIGGGYPLFQDSILIGAVGASGDHYPRDMAVLRSAMEATGFSLDP